MEAKELERLRAELAEFLGVITEGMGRMERCRAMQAYVTGLLLDGERKSIQPMAARLVQEPSEAEAMRQRLQECITISDWNADEVWSRLALHVAAKIPELEAFVLDDTGFPKKGEHSVGVARQYSGTLGRVDNCQIATSLHLAGEAGSACIGMRLYLPEGWAKDEERRRKAGVPEEVEFRPKWQLGLELLDKALDWGLDKRVVLADAGYGDCMEFRQELRKRALPYVLGILSTIVVWRPGEGPEPPPIPSEKKLGRPRTKWQTGEATPVSVMELALERGRRALHTVRWREGSRGRQKSQFGFERVRTAHGHTKGHAPGHEQWLIYEWPKGEPEPTKFWLADLPKGTSQRKLVRLAKLRWRVERDYQDMKGEVGLDHFEGRTWRGFHHHAVLCAVAHAFLALQRARFRRGNHPLLRTLGAVKRFLQMVLLCILGGCPTCGRRVSALSLPAAPSRI